MSFDCLPYEILLQIFEFIPNEDLPSLFLVCVRFKEFLQTFAVESTLNLEKAHLLSVCDVKSFFNKNGVASSLKTLSFNGVWWIDSSKYIFKCSNLRVLRIIDVRLNAAQFKSIFQTCLQIEDIEFSWPSDLTLSKIKDFKDCEFALKKLKFIKFLTSKWRPHLLFLKNTSSVVKLTVIYDSLIAKDSVLNGTGSYDISSDEDLNHLVLPNLEDIQIVSRTLHFQRFLNRIHLKLSSSSHFRLEKFLLWPFPNLSCLCQQTTSGVDWMQHCEVMEFAMCHDLERSLTPISFPLVEELFLYGRHQNSATDFVSKMPKLRSFHYFARSPVPLSLHHIHKLHPKLQKLSFWCMANAHSMSYVLGELENFKELKQLCVPPCVLEEKLPEPVAEKPFKQHFLFKRQRVGEAKSSEKAGSAAFNNVIDNSPSLKVLEIALFRDVVDDDVCRRTPIHWQCLENIKKLGSLTHLTLELIPVTSGAFIKTIAENCEKLEFLRLKDLGLSGKCIFLKELSEALPVFRSLKSFRLENNYLLPGSTIFRALGECDKLERLSVISKKEVYLLDETSLVSLLCKKSLIFAYVDVCGVTASSVIRMKKQLKSTKSDYLFYHITSENFMQQTQFLPLKHSREMVQYLPWVTV